MEIYPPIEQRFSPFDFYSSMRKNNPIVFDDENERWGVYRYNDIEKILRDHSRFSSKFGPIEDKFIFLLVNHSKKIQIQTIGYKRGLFP